MSLQPKVYLASINSPEAFIHLHAVEAKMDHHYARTVRSKFVCFILSSELVLTSDARPKRPKQAESYRGPHSGCFPLTSAQDGRQSPCLPLSTFLFTALLVE